MSELAEAPRPFPLADYWQEWIVDNPFLVHDLRRWRKRGFDWKIPLAAGGAPVLVLLLVHLAVTVRPPGSGSFFDERTGIFILSLVSLVHLLAAVIFSTQTFALSKEATADRLDFIRILPLRRRELMVKLGLARAVLRLPAALAAFPVYVLLLSYGSVEPEDIAGLYALYLLMLFAPPGLGEVTQSLTMRKGSTPTGPGQKQAGAANPMFAAWMILQGILQVFAGPVLGRLVMVMGRRLGTVVGARVGLLLPLSLFVALGRMLVLVQPFYRWWVMPLIPLGVYWLLRNASRVVTFAELFSREPVLHSQSQGRQVYVLPEVTGRKDEQRTKRRLEALYTTALYLSIAGLAWRPMVLSGALGAFTNHPTAQGGIAALLIVLVVFNSLPTFERLRSGLDSYQATPTPVRDSALELLRMLGRVAATLLAACLLGWVSPWPDAARALLLLVPALLVMLAFAAGWRAMANRRWETARAKQGTPSSSFADVIWLLIWLATYILPLAAFSRSASPWWHFLAALSPIYVLLSLLPGFWSEPSPVPLPLALLLPALAGGVLFAVSPRNVAAARAEEAARPRRDPLEARARQLAARLDNPFLTLAVNRLLRRPLGLSFQLAFAVALGIGVPLGMILMIFSAAAADRGVTAFQELARPLGRTGWQVGGLVCFMFAAMVLLFTLGIASGMFAGVVRMENAAARQQGRMHFLLITSLGDRGIVAGLIAAVALQALPLVTAGLASSLMLVLLALSYHAAWWVLPAWIWAVWMLGSGALLTGCATFQEWRLRRGFRRFLWQFFRFAAPIGLVGGGMIYVVRSIQWLVLGWREYVGVLPALGGVLAVAALLALPWRWRTAVGAVRSVRTEDDLERAK